MKIAIQLNLAKKFKIFLKINPKPAVLNQQILKFKAKKQDKTKECHFY